MSPRTLLLLLLAVVIAGGTALLARSYLASQRAQEVALVAPQAPKPQHSILVAKGDVTRGQILKPDDLVWQVWPDDAMTPAYIVQGGGETPQRFAGWVAVDPIAGRAPVTKTTIISPGSGGFLAAVLKPGMRAIQLPVPQGLPIGAVLGDRVDIMVRVALQDAGLSDGSVVETVLSGVRILDINGSLRAQLEGGKAAQTQPGGTSNQVTFEVTPKQAEVAVLAQQMGTLTATLDSLRQVSGHTAWGTGTKLAAATDPKADPPNDPDPPGDLIPVRTASSEGLDTPEDGATYMTDGQVNRFLRFKQVDGFAITVLRGDKAKPDTVSSTLRCTEDGCAVADKVPTRLVGMAADK